jgi:hypothetical protein
MTLPVSSRPGVLRIIVIARSVGGIGPARSIADPATAEPIARIRKVE